MQNEDAGSKRTNKQKALNFSVPRIIRSYAINFISIWNSKPHQQKSVSLTNKETFTRTR